MNIVRNMDNKFNGFIGDGRDIEELVLAGKMGDAMAEEEIIKRFTPLVYKEAKKVSLKNYDLEDLVQLGYIAIMRAVEKYNPEPKKGNFVSYVSCCIRNKFYELIRKFAKENHEDSLDEVLRSSDNDQNMNLTRGDIISDSFCMEENIVLKEERDILYLAINKLSDKYREVLIECVLKDITIKEYAARKNMSYRMATQRKHRAIELLKKMIIDDK